MIREITITPVLNGFLCKVGCQSVVFNSRDSLLNHLSVYLERGHAFERAFVRDSENRWLMEQGAAPPQPTQQAAVPNQAAHLAEPRARRWPQPTQQAAVPNQVPDPPYPTPPPGVFSGLAPVVPVSK